MAKDFKKELTELINKHGLEKEMRDTPDYILAQVCIDAMAVFTEAIARRDEMQISELIENFKKTDDNEEKIMINAVLKDVSNALNRPDEKHEKEIKSHG